MNKFKETFNGIRAEEALKDSTRSYIAAKTRGYSRGTVIKRRLYACTAVCACLAVLFFGGNWLYFTPTAEIGIDINPSMELSVNRFDRIISVSGFNDDGRELAGTLDLQFKGYAEAVELILANEKIAAMLSDNEILSITVSGSDEAQSAKILSEIEETASHHENTYYHYCSSEETKDAHQAGLSCGRYKLYLELNALDPEVTAEEVENMSISELRALIESLSENSTSAVGNEHENEHEYEHEQHHSHH